MAIDNWERVLQDAQDRLHSPDATVRSDAALALGKLDAEEARDDLVAQAIDALSRILDDPDEYVRKSAVHALGRLRVRDARALEGIRFALGDRSEQVVQEAVAQVLQAADPGSVEGLIKVLGRRERTLQSNAMQALIKIGPDAVRPLLETFKDRTLRRRVHNQVLRIIMDIRGRAVEPLLEALDDENFHVRGYAVALLGKLGDERAIEPMVRLFLTDPRMQETVVNTLPRLEERAVIEAPHGDRDVHLPKEVAAAFRRLAGPEALAALRAAIDSPNPKVRKFAMRALFEVQGGQSKERLLALLEDEDVEVQRLAVKLLGKLHDKSVIEPLLALLKPRPQLEETVWNTVKVLTDLREYEALRSRVAREKAGVPARPTVRVFKKERDVSPDWWRDQD